MSTSKTPGSKSTRNRKPKTIEASAVEVSAKPVDAPDGESPEATEAQETETVSQADETLASVTSSDAQGGEPETDEPKVEEKSEPESPEKTVSSKPAEKPKTGLGLVLALVAGVAGGLGAATVLPLLGVGQNQENAATQSAIGELQSSISSLQGKVSQIDQNLAQNQNAASDGAASVEAVSSQLQAQLNEALGSVQSDLAALKAQADALAAQENMPDEIAQALEALRQSQADFEAKLSQRVDGLNAEIDAYLQDVTVLQRVSATTQQETQRLRQEVARLGEVVEQQKSAAAARLAEETRVAGALPVLQALQTAVAEGRPHVEFSASLLALGFDEAALAPLLVSDVPSNAVLFAGVRELREAIVAAQPAPETSTEETGVLQGLKSSLGGLVKVRRKHEAAAPLPLSGVEQAVASGQFAKALEELEAASLPEGVDASALQSQLQARLAFENAVAATRDQLTASLKKEG